MTCNKPLCSIALLIASCWLSAGRAAAEIPTFDNAGDGVCFHRRDEQLHITVDGHYFATYVWSDPKTTRPYFKQIHALGGTTQLTRNHPPEPGDFDDHETYHPGIWWGFGDVGGNDYWRMKARIIGGDFIEPPTGHGDWGAFVVRNQMLRNGSDERFCHQICRYQIRKRPSGILMICETTIQRDEADFWLGDQEEMGLAFRVATPLTVEKGGRYLDSAGRTTRKQLRTNQADWCDYSGKIAEQFGGLMVMNDPRNFRRPWWHAVETGLMVANPLGESELGGQGKRRENLLVKKGTPFQLRYGLLVHLHDEAQQFDPAAAYADFVSLISD